MAENPEKERERNKRNMALATVTFIIALPLFPEKLFS
jgi:hypothetical protein